MAYKNPTPVVVGLVFTGYNKILLVRRSISPHKGEMALPGGYVAFGEDWRVALAREIREEASIQVSTDPKHMKIFDATSTPDGSKILLFAKVEKGGIKRTFKFKKNRETSERVSVDIGYYNSPQVCFPLHQQVVNRYRDENYTFEDAHPGGY